MAINRQKISQMTPKGADLDPTDLLEVSVDTGSGYETRSITGQEIIDGGSGVYVPYTGANQDVDLGEFELKAGQLTLDITPTGTATVGTTQWNDTIGSSETTLKGGSVILKNGVDLLARVVNKVTPNATLTKANYTAVKISGAQGQRLAVGYAQANNDNNSADTIGVVIETIPTNQEGFIMTVGNLEEVNTTGSLQGETWSDGDVLYLSPTTPGALTNVKPNGSTGHIVVMGYVEYAHAIHGKIYVKIMNGWELDELHNVYINTGTLANNDALIYESSTQLWKNKPVTESIISLSDVTTNDVSITKHGFVPKAPNDTTKFLRGDGTWATAGGGITVGTTAVTSGTDGRVFFQAGGVVQQDANFFWDNTNLRLSIGQGSSPLARLDVRAQGALSTDIAFRVRNSADTYNTMAVRGNGVIDFQNPTLGSTFLTIGQVGAGNSADCFLDFSGSRGIRNRQGGVVQTGIRIFYNSTSRNIGTYISATENSGDNTIFIDGGNNIRIGQGFSNTNQPDANATRTIQQMTGIAPTTSIADGFQQYSADITAGNAAPHFRTENGSIVKLYQQTTGVAASTFAMNTSGILNDTATFDGYTIGQVVKALRNLGILA